MKIFDYLFKINEPVPKKLKCQDCGGDKFISGPSGGGAVNICCSNPDCRSAFWYGYEFGTKRIPNTVFRESFPECPEESEQYLKEEILQQLNKETDEAIRRREQYEQYKKADLQ